MLIEILPKEDKAFYSKKWYNKVIFFYKLLCSTSLGKICASEHALSAADEMQALASDMGELIKKQELIPQIFVTKGQRGETIYEQIAIEKKKLITIFVCIGIVGSVIAGLVAMAVYTSLLTDSLVGDFGKYVYLAEKLEDSSKCIVDDEKNEVSGVIAIRDGLSDYCVKYNACTFETTSIFTSSKGDFPLSRGIWCAVTRLDENGELKPLKNSFALTDLNKALDNGYGEKLYGYILQGKEVKVALKKYAVRDLVCYPVEIAIYSEDNQLTDSISCSIMDDISDLTIVEAEDVYLSTANIKTNLMSALAGSEASAEYAQKTLAKTDFSKDGIFREKSLYPSKAVVNSVSVENGYAFIYSAVVDTSSSAFGIFGAVATLWLIIVVIIGAVTVAIRKE